MMTRLAELHGRGVAKYGENNWMCANSIEEYLRFKQSAFRHMFQWMQGIDDEDHAAAVQFNINCAEMVKTKLDLTEEQVEEYMNENARKVVEKK